jgi:hypothetical protein
VKKPRKSAAPTHTAPGKSKSSKRLFTAASMLVLPMTMLSTRAGAQAVGTKPPVSTTKPVPTAAQSVTPFIKLVNVRAVKLPGTYTILGVNGGHTIYAGPDGKYFYVDPATGDQKMLSTQWYDKWHSSVTYGREKLKGTSQAVAIVGVDQAGNVIQKNARGETFYLNQSTGDFVFVKLPN